MAVVLATVKSSLIFSQETNQKNQSSAEQEILTLEKEWYDAFLRTDTDAMNRIEANDFLIITGTTETPVTKERQLANIRARSESGALGNSYAPIFSRRYRANT